MPEYEQAVFISYAWSGEREDTVNQIDESLQKRGISIIRDKRALGYKGSIKEFMERIGQGNCVIVVISDKYLRSPNCMFELVEIAENKQLHDRVFPIVLSDANIYDPLKRIEYVKHWEAKRAELARAMKKLDPANLQGLRDDMDQYDRIRDKISGITSILKDMNTLTPDMHRDSDFSDLYNAIVKRMEENPVGSTPESDRVSKKVEEEDKLKAKEEADRLVAQKAKAEAERRVKDEGDRLAAQKAGAERLANQKADEERLAQAMAKVERKAKKEVDRLAAQKAEADAKAEAKQLAHPVSAELKLGLNPDSEVAKPNLEDVETEYSNERQKAIDVFPSQKENVRPKVIIGLTSIVIILSVIAGLGFIYIFGRDYFGPKNTIIFEPDYSRVSAIDSSVLEKTAEVLTARSHDLGYSNISFVVTGDSQIVGEIPSYIDTKVLIERISPIGLLEFVNFGETPLPEGTVISTDLENMYIQPTDEKKWHTIMTNSDILAASAKENQIGEFQISFILTEDGKKIFADYTTANIDTYLGIVLDKVIISVPIIQMPILDGEGVISGAFTQENAQDLAIILHTTPLPIPIKLIQDIDSAK